MHLWYFSSFFCVFSVLMQKIPFSMIFHFLPPVYSCYLWFLSFRIQYSFLKLTLTNLFSWNPFSGCLLFSDGAKTSSSSSSSPGMSSRSLGSRSSCRESPLSILNLDEPEERFFLCSGIPVIKGCKILYTRKA